MTTTENACDPADATSHKGEPADPTAPATRLTDAFLHLDRAQRIASARDVEMGAPRIPQSTDREPGVRVATVVDEASELSAAREAAILPLDNPVAHIGSSGVEAAADIPRLQTTLREQHRQLRGCLTGKSWPIVRVLLPFAVGFYLTNLFRTINALISDQLTSDLVLGAADLGLLTSVYFLTFAAAQIPIGILLDRYGPRRVESALLFVAARRPIFPRRSGRIPHDVAPHSPCGPDRCRNCTGRSRAAAHRAGNRGGAHQPSVRHWTESSEASTGPDPPTLPNLICINVVRYAGAKGET